MVKTQRIVSQIQKDNQPLSQQVKIKINDSNNENSSLVIKSSNQSDLIGVAIEPTRSKISHIELDFLDFNNEENFKINEVLSSEISQKLQNSVQKKSKYSNEEEKNHIQNECFEFAKDKPINKKEKKSEPLQISSTDLLILSKNSIPTKSINKEYEAKDETGENEPKIELQVKSLNNVNLIVQIEENIKIEKDKVQNNSNNKLFNHNCLDIGNGNVDSNNVTFRNLVEDTNYIGSKFNLIMFKILKIMISTKNKMKILVLLFSHLIKKKKNQIVIIVKMKL
jgi:hypothetical protein